ncbi:MAG: hypothetical protein JSW28_07025 [Thermoplasmata archaeon]|nr:MAG: hypothetical protein JSW28_07025 [Thermoplasmata archaeon]
MSSHYDSMGFWAKSIGYNYAILRNKQEALNWLNEGVEYYLKIDEFEKREGNRIRYVHALRILDCVVPLQDEGLYNTVSVTIEGLSPEPVPGTDRISTEIFEAYFDCMAPLLRGDYDTAAKRLPRLKKWEKDWKECKYYEGLSDSIEGIVQEDGGQFLIGVGQILKIFKRRNAQLKGMPICTEATSIFILAKRRGLKVELADIDKKYRMLIADVFIDL